MYEERRAESFKVFQETQSKRAQVDGHLQRIKERLDELDAEREELKEYQENDKRRRAIEHAVTGLESADVNEKLQQLESRFEREVRDSRAALRELEDENIKVQDLDSRHKEKRQQIERLKEQKAITEDRRQEVVRTHAQLEVQVRTMTINKDDRRQSIVRLVIFKIE